MTTVKTTSVLIKTDNLVGSGSLEYDATSMIQESPLKLTWSGGVLSFNTIAEYRSFITQVVLPMTDTVNSPSGVGNGFVVSSAGVAGSDTVTN